MANERDETEAERLDRNTAELVSELRVAATGVQVLFAFLLIVPFNNRWTKVTAFERHVYYVTLLAVAVAAVLLIAPSVQHRILFRYGQKAYIVKLGNRLAIIASGFMAVGITGIVVLISDFLFGHLAAGVGGVCAAVFTTWLWFAIPLAKRRG